MSICIANIKHMTNPKITPMMLGFQAYVKEGLLTIAVQ